MAAKHSPLFKFSALALACAGLFACGGTSTPSLNSGTPSAGDADFSKYVAIGDSLTAGYTDGALYRMGQESSFPAILAGQFKDIGGGTFNQPLADEKNLGGMKVGGDDSILLNRFVLDTQAQKPVRLSGTPTEEVTNSGLNGQTFENMGVTGAKSYHLVAPGYGAISGLAAQTANPFFVRFSRDPNDTSETLMDSVIAQNPSFFTLWVGGNDVLSFATSGGTVDTKCQPVSNPASCDADALTDPDEFTGLYQNIVAAIKASNPAVKGVVINIPDVSTIPFFTTVPYNPVPLDQATADQLNSMAAYGAYNAGLQQALAGGAIDQAEFDKRKIVFAEGQNAVVIMDEFLTDLTGLNPALLSMRQATAEDLVLLPASSYIGTEDKNCGGEGSNPPAGKPWGVGMPLGDCDVLTPEEVQEINAVRTKYNNAIKAVADGDANIILVDADAMMTELNEKGITYYTTTVHSEFVKGGAYSLDGVHPSSRGYAVLANRIIEAINEGFNANVFLVDPGIYAATHLK